MLFTNPREWAKGAVGSWWRLAFVTAGSIGFIIYAVYAAAEDGVRLGLGVAILPSMLQFYSLYALRRMYLQAIGAEVDKNAV
jgi:hypothetical protein